MAAFIREVLREDPELAKRIIDKSGMSSVLAELKDGGARLEKNIKTQSDG